MNNRKLLLLCLCCFCFNATLLSETHTVKVGETITVYCNASAPAGYITHAFFSLADPQDAAYVAISGHAQEQYATITGLAPKSSIKVGVTYHYSYYGSYDHAMHVGSSTYYDYITVTGGKKPTRIDIEPKEPEIAVGESITLKVVSTPSDASTTYPWGIITSLGAPYNFTLDAMGPQAVVTAKGPGKLYIAIQAEDNLVATAIVTAINKDIDAQSVSFANDEITLSVGEKKRLRYNVEPSGATTKFTWQSSSTSVLTVDESGQVTAVGVGSCYIQIVSEDKTLTSRIPVTVVPVAESILLSDVELTYGYPLKLNAVVIPKSANPKFSWSSSDPSLIVVDKNGVLTAKKPNGSASIILKTDNGIESSCKVTIKEASYGCDVWNLNKRFKAIVSLTNRTLESNR